MKKLLLLFIPLVFFFGCEEDENNNDNSTTGYNCIDNDCFSEEGGQYTTLQDCLSVCENECLLYGNWELNYVYDSDGYCAVFCSTTASETPCVSTYNEDYSNCLMVSFNVDGTFSETFINPETEGWGTNNGVWFGGCDIGDLITVVIDDIGSWVVNIDVLNSNTLIIDEVEGQAWRTSVYSR